MEVFPIFLFSLDQPLKRADCDLCALQERESKGRASGDEQDGGEGTAVTLPGSTGTVCIDVNTKLVSGFLRLWKDFRVCKGIALSLSQCSQVAVGIQHP